MEASIPLNVGDAGEVPSGLQVAAIVAPILPKATPAIRATPEEANLWLSAGADDALALRPPLPDGALRIVAKGEKEDKALSSLFDPHRHHTARVGAQKIWAGILSASLRTPRWARIKASPGHSEEELAITAVSKQK